METEATRTEAPPALLWPLLIWVFVGGALVALFGIGLLGWQLYFRAGAKEVEGFIALDPAGRKVLQVRDGQRVVEFPIRSPESIFDFPLGPVPYPVLYNAELHAVDLRTQSNTWLLGGIGSTVMGSLFMLLCWVNMRYLRRAKAGPKGSCASLMQSSVQSAR